MSVKKFYILKTKLYSCLLKSSNMIYNSNSSFIEKAYKKLYLHSTLTVAQI